MPKATLLLYDPLSSPWVPRLKQHCAVQGLRLRVVEPCHLSRTVGALAQGLAPAGELPPGEPVPEPVLVFCSLTGSQLDKLLAALRRLEVPRTTLKAVLTPTNAAWPFSQLYRELCRERLAMSGPAPAPEHLPLP